MSVKEVFDTEVAELEKRELQENKAVEAMEQKRAEEKEKGRTEIMEELEEEEEGRTETIELEEIRRERREIIREPKKEVFPETLPVCTRTPRMLVTGKILYQKFTLLANNPKYLHQRSIGMS
jgi:hypothetical protein